MKGRTKKGRKKTAERKASRGAKLAAHEKILKMIRERDAQILEAAGDPMKAYNVAPGVEELVSEVAILATKNAPGGVPLLGSERFDQSIANKVLFL
jgi:hypothetical protein